MTRKLSDLHYVHNQERTSLLPLKRLQITLFTFLRNLQFKWMLWSIDLRTIIAYKQEMPLDIVRTALLLMLTFSPAVALFFMILTLLFL